MGISARGHRLLARTKQEYVGMTKELANALTTIMQPGFGQIEKALRPGFGEVAEPPLQFDGPWSKELVQAIAMDIGKDTVAYIEVMYPQAITATSSTFKLSIRNHIYNQIMAAIEV